MPYPLISQAASAEHEVTGTSTIAVFVPRVPLDSSASIPKFAGVLCTLDELAEIPMSPLFDGEIMGVGKTATAITSRDIKVDPFTLTIQGGDFKTLQILLGLDPTSATNAAPQIIGSYGVVGHLLINYHNTATKEHRGSVLVLNVEGRLLTLPGATADGRVLHKIEFRSTSARVHISQAGIAFAVEGWKSPNSTAPNGTATDFILGTGNNAYASSTTPVALQVNSADATRTGYRTHFCYLGYNGSEVAEGAATFNAGTSTITFGSAPAAGYLTAIYPMSTATIQPPNTHSTSLADSIRFPFQDYV